MPSVPTNEPYSEEVFLRDGTRCLLRSLEPTDKSMLEAAFRELSTRSIQFRFGRIFEPSDEQFERWTRINNVDEFALVMTQASLDLKEERGLGIGRLVRSPEDPWVAEAAITVLDSVQGRGVGSAIGEALLRAAMKRGIRSLQAYVMTENEIAIRALRDAGAWERRVDEHTVEFKLEVRVDRKSNPWLRVFRQLVGGVRSTS